MRGLLIVILIIGLTHHVLSQNFILKGTVKSASSGEPVANAHIHLLNTDKGTISDSFGFFSIQVSSQTHILKISHIGFQAKIIQLQIYSDTLINIELENISDLREVKVVAKEINTSIDKTQMSTFQVPLKEIKLLPSVLGETDIIKSIHFVPGVKSGNEGSLGYYVRGGSPDQNLIILDGIPMYNINHMLGLYSVLNTDIINSSTLYKGGFPARFGGRLSSVMEIKTNEGNLFKYHGNISAGLIFAKMNLEGPIKKGKIGFNISARRTYADLIYGLAQKFIPPSDNSGSVYFSDFNSKFNFKISDKSTIYLNTFWATDDAAINIQDSYAIDNQPWEDNTDIQINFKNYVAYLSWDYFYNSKFSFNSKLAFSRYFYNISHDYFVEDQNQQERNNINFSYKSNIFDLILSSDFRYKPSEIHDIRFGFNISIQENNPGVTAVEYDLDKIDGDYSDTEDILKPLKGYIYFEDDWSLSNKIKTNFGVHFSGYKINNTMYSAIEPRFSFLYHPSKNLSFKTSYVKMKQYIHLLTTTTIRSPVDLWVPPTEKVKPQESSQFALGVFYNIPGFGEVSIEGFYKSMNGVIEYKEGTTFLGSSQGWEDKIEAGKGWAYGAELLISKKLGKLTGWLGYTLSWSERKFPTINSGNVFPFRYDNRHDISLVLLQKISENIDAGVTWVYSTGNAVTLHTNKFLAKSNPESTTDLSDEAYFNTRNSYRLGVVNTYENRNNYRMPAYHRLDFSINFKKQKKYGTRTWKLGLYNAYNHQNPYFLFLGYDKSTTITTINQDGSENNSSRKVLKQFSLLPIMPSISYNLTF